MQKIKFLDGLRGSAALMVVIHHFILAFYPALFFGPNAAARIPGGVENFAASTPINVLYNGNFAVCIFFMLSGFVLSLKFFVKKDFEVIIASAVKRYFRLVFPVAFSVLLAYVFMKFSLFYNQQAGQLVGSDWLGSFWTFTPNLREAIVQAFYGTVFASEYSYNTVLWTIVYEFFGAFLIYGFLLMFGKNKFRYLFYLPFIFFFFQTYYLAFILGMMLSDFMVNNKLILHKFDKTKLLRIVLLLFGLFVGSFPSGRSAEGTVYQTIHFVNWDTLPMLYHILGAFLVLWILLESKKLQKLFSNKYFLILGDLSFAMYLLHFIVLGSFASFTFLLLQPVTSYAIAFLITLSLSLPLIFLASWVMHQSLEKYAFNFSQFVYADMFLRPIKMIKQKKEEMLPERI